MMRARWAHWCLQSASFVLALCFAARAVAQTVAATPAPAPTSTESLTISTALNVLGLFVMVLIGRWSWNQDKAIQRAQDTADQAQKDITALRLELAQRHLPKAETAAAMEAALKPIQNELHSMRSEMSEMRKQAGATSTQIINALVGRAAVDG